MGYDGLCIFVITMALSVILRDFQATIGVKRFVFSIKDLAPFIAAIVCILVFKHRTISRIEIFYQFKSD